MKCRIITLFPEFFASPLSTGLMGKAVTSGILDVDIIDLRAYSDDRHRRCDDYTYGGGSGMVLKPEP
ncbi:MAG TPA: tRNA (guanine(37)-N(1))-methyltransferase, partial [Spirochaetota bacterium]|nr:tRNA (guanine(37)-N(1))-methyltransferase [Spirochaetota bacterium]